MWPGEEVGSAVLGKNPWCSIKWKKCKCRNKGRKNKNETIISVESELLSDFKFLHFFLKKIAKFLFKKFYYFYINQKKIVLDCHF